MLVVGLIGSNSYGRAVLVSTPTTGHVQRSVDWYFERDVQNFLSLMALRVSICDDTSLT